MKQGKSRAKLYLAIIFIVFAITIPVTLLFAVKYPAYTTYHRLFLSHYQMAVDQATLEGMLTQVQVFHEQMNTVFHGYEYETTYNSVWFWEQRYDNSLQAEEDYLTQLETRLQVTINDNNAILAGNKSILIPYAQWYQAALDSLRIEMVRSGGLDWAVDGAWFIHFAPLVYWLNVFDWLIPLGFVICAGICVASWTDFLKHFRKEML